MLFMHHEQKVNFIIVSNELQKITAFTMPWPLINILSQLQMFKKRYVVFELIFWKIKFNNSFNNTVQHTYVLLKHVVLDVRQYVPSQNHVMFHRISNAEIIALRFSHLLALLLRVNEP